MKLLNEFKKAQEQKDYKRVHELRVLMEEESKTMPEIVVSGISGTQLFHWQGGIGLPPSAVKVNGEWYMLDRNDPRSAKIRLTPPTQNKRGLAVLVGRLYHRKYTLPLITIDDLRELLEAK